MKAKSGENRSPEQEGITTALTAASASPAHAARTAALNKKGLRPWCRDDSAKRKCENRSPEQEGITTSSSLRPPSRTARTAALNKKGLRRPRPRALGQCSARTAALNKKGLRRRQVALHDRARRENRSPEQEGITTRASARSKGTEARTAALNKKGLRPRACNAPSPGTVARTAALNKKGLRPRMSPGDGLTLARTAALNKKGLRRRSVLGASG